MAEKSKEELEKYLNECNEEIEMLQKRLIDSLNTVGIEYVDLYKFIDEINQLSMKKSRISYQLNILI